MAHLDAVRADLVNVVPSSAPPGMWRVAPSDVPHSWLVAKITQDSPGGASGTYGARMHPNRQAEERQGSGQDLRASVHPCRAYS